MSFINLNCFFTKTLHCNSCTRSIKIETVTSVHNDWGFDLLPYWIIRMYACTHGYAVNGTTVFRAKYCNVATAWEGFTND